MEHAFLLVAIFCAFVLFMGAIIWLGSHFDKKRTEALRAVATDIGLQFLATKDEELLAKMNAFPLFNKGRSRKIKNVMTTETDIARLTIFDYQYTTSSGKNSHTHHHTVVSMESDALSLPHFSLSPEGFFQRVGAAIGMQDIDFEAHPEFSSSFVLKADNEQSVRMFFDAEVLKFLAQRKGICVESAPGAFIYFRGARRKPEQVHEFMNEAFTIYSAFAERLSRTTSSSN